MVRCSAGLVRRLLSAWVYWTQKAQLPVELCRLQAKHLVWLGVWLAVL